MFELGGKNNAEWSFYKCIDCCKYETSLVGIDKEFFYTDGKENRYSSDKINKGFYSGAMYGDYKAISKSVYDAEMKKLVPDKVKLVSKNKNTELNRDKFFGSLSRFKKSIK